MMRTKKVLPVLCTLGIALLGMGILADSTAVAQGIRDGLGVCGNVLVPSLFPFMALAGYVSRTDFARLLSLPLAPVTTRVFKLPAELGAVVLLSLVGGYPVGARMISDLLAEGRIQRKTAQRMLCFCVNSGPSFLVSAVGVGMLMDRRAGVILLGSQILATLLVGAVVSLRAKEPPGMKPRAAKTGGTAAFVSAVSGASSSMLVMCAFAVLFSAGLSLLRSSGVVEALAEALSLREAVVSAVLGGLLEVTSGCLNAVKVGGLPGFGLLCAAVSFGGLSVICQVMSCFEGQEMGFRGYLLSRGAHAAIAAAVAVPLYSAFCGERSVLAAAYPPVMHSDGKTWIISVCLMAMCSILVMNIGKK